MWKVKISNKTTHIAENMKYWTNIKSIVHFVEIIYIHEGCVQPVGQSLLSVSLRCLVTPTRWQV